MKIRGADKSELMEISTIERKGNDLVMKGKVYGAMPMTAVLTPEEAKKFGKLLSFKLVLFLLTMPFRKSEDAK